MPWAAAIGKGKASHLQKIANLILLPKNMATEWLYAIAQLLWLCLCILPTIIHVCHFNLLQSTCDDSVTICALVHSVIIKN